MRGIEVDVVGEKERREGEMKREKKETGQREKIQDRKEGKW